MGKKKKIAQDYTVQDKHLRAGSHLPVLSTLLENTTGAVLELGCGYYSTPLLFYHCKAYNRPFASYENDNDWQKKFEQLGTQYTDDWSAVPIDDTHWSIALIDHRPALQRHRDAIRLKDNTDFIVLHDTDPEIEKFYAYRRVWKHFKYVYHFNTVKPFTSVLSNVQDPASFFYF